MANKICKIVYFDEDSITDYRKMRKTLFRILMFTSGL